MKLLLGLLIASVVLYLIYNRNQLETTLHDVPDKNFMGPF